MITDLLSATAVLVVAPHPDDEALGCGGLIAALAERGARLGVLFVTDGGASHPGSHAWPRARLARLRAEEATASLDALGAADAERLHLGLPDADMPPQGPCRDAAVARSARLAAELRPDLALLPWRRDPHRDHRDSHVLALEAMDRAGLRPRILEYAVWLEEFGAPGDWPRPGETATHRLDISPWRARKRAAVAAHRSQCGAMIHDDPGGFALSEATIRRLTSGPEVYFEAAG
jgi:LmbE family N-acetylglucosaminyl deacetylase